MEKKYPDRFYDPLRMEIATTQIMHDLRKLFPSLDSDSWDKIDGDVMNWFSGEKFELEPVHDFWSLYNGLARGLKLKSLTSWTTADNINWSKEDVPVDKIIITWDFPGLEFMPKAPYPAVEVINKLEDPKMQIRKSELKEESEYRSSRFSPRDQFRIVLFYDQDGGVISKYPGYYILEGNRRTVRAILQKTPTIPAYVAQFKNKADKWPKNYWITTGVLRDLIFLAIGYEKDRDEVAFDTVRKIYQLLMRDFDVARIVTFDKTFKTFETSERLIKEIFLEDLK